MKIYLAIALLSMLSCAFAEGVDFSPRVLVKPLDMKNNPITGNENAVDLARALLLELQLYNLMDQVVQAKINVDPIYKFGLLFEMQNAMQAAEVAQAWIEPNGEIVRQLTCSQDTLDFFD
ncbi:uncharacterized protein LOC108605311 [Drosophila busckii]|uniref:uncharacterized protein LOC108605311 n=1 Tax=Drosophila busckii TaxID=30019 RepID=UPI00083ED05E|nr:uncharacterized protein LOC108605311 [Drosophila busckii]